MAFIANQIGLQSSDGFITMNTNATGVVFAFTTSYQELRSLGTNFVLASPAQNFDMVSDGRLRYIGISTKTFAFDVYYTQATGTNLALQLYKNGSPVAGSEWFQGFTSGNIMKFPVSMVTNDYVSVWGKRSSASNATIHQIILSAGSANGS